MRSMDPPAPETLSRNTIHTLPPYLHTLPLHTLHPVPVDFCASLMHLHSFLILFLGSHGNPPLLYKDLHLICASFVR